MANLNPKEAEPLTAAEIQAYADELDTFLRVLRKAEAEALKQPGQTLFTYGKASGKAGIDRMRTLIQQISVSVFNAQLGKPLKLGERRSKRRQDPEKG